VPLVWSLPVKRADPPPDITPRDFFTRWVPEAVARDEERRRKLGSTDARIEFTLEGESGGVYSLRVVAGEVRGFDGASAEADLRVRVDVPTWRRLNAGTISAPEALLKRHLRVSGDLVLALKLHLILG
jgi:putative sterol carrier protein